VASAAKRRGKVAPTAPKKEAREQREKREGEAFLAQRKRDRAAANAAKEKFRVDQLAASKAAAVAVAPPRTKIIPTMPVATKTSRVTAKGAVTKTVKKTTTAKAAPVKGAHKKAPAPKARQCVNSKEEAASFLAKRAEETEEREASKEKWVQSELGEAKLRRPLSLVD
jgi:hypothetical protein